MRLNNLDFLETLKPNCQIFGGDSDSNVDVDLNGLIDVEFDITELDFNDAGVYIADGWDVTVTVNNGWAEIGSHYYPIY